MSWTTWKPKLVVTWRRVLQVPLTFYVLLQIQLWFR